MLTNGILNEYTLEELRETPAEDLDFDRVSIWTIMSCEDPDLQLKFRSQLGRLVDESINWMLDNGIIEEVK